MEVSKLPLFNLIPHLDSVGEPQLLLIVLLIRWNLCREDAEAVRDPVWHGGS